MVMEANCQSSQSDSRKQISSKSPTDDLESHFTVHCPISSNGIVVSQPLSQPHWKNVESTHLSSSVPEEKLSTINSNKPCSISSNCGGTSLSSNSVTNTHSSSPDNIMSYNDKMSSISVNCCPPAVRQPPRLHNAKSLYNAELQRQLENSAKTILRLKTDVEDANVDCVRYAEQLHNYALETSSSKDASPEQHITPTTMTENDSPGSDDFCKIDEIADLQSPVESQNDVNEEKRTMPEDIKLSLYKEKLLVLEQSKLQRELEWSHKTETIATDLRVMKTLLMTLRSTEDEVTPSKESLLLLLEECEAQLEELRSQQSALDAFFSNLDKSLIDASNEASHSNQILYSTDENCEVHDRGGSEDFIGRNETGSKSCLDDRSSNSPTESETTDSGSCSSDSRSITPDSETVKPVVDSQSSVADSNSSEHKFDAPLHTAKKHDTESMQRDTSNEFKSRKSLKPKHHKSRRRRRDSDDHKQVAKAMHQRQSPRMRRLMAVMSGAACTVNGLLAIMGGATVAFHGAVGATTSTVGSAVGVVNAANGAMLTANGMARVVGGAAATLTGRVGLARGAAHTLNGMMGTFTGTAGIVSGMVGAASSSAGTFTGMIGIIRGTAGTIGGMVGVMRGTASTISAAFTDVS